MIDINEFYPTPTSVIDKLLSDVDYDNIRYCLEPSAGKGDIAKYIVDKIGNRARSMSIGVDAVDVVEINPDLQNVLKGKGLRLIHDDFLTLDTYKQYDIIAMNPPFSNGDEHLLKAIELQSRYGGQIRCILNAETIRNPYSNRRKELVSKLDELNANIKYYQDAFNAAERKTGVEIAIIKIDIPKIQNDSIIFEDLKKAEEIKQAQCPESADLITNDYIKGIVQQFNFEVRLGLKLIDEAEYVNSKILKTFGDDKKPLLILTLNEYQDGWGCSAVDRNVYVKRVRTKYWTALFKNKTFTGLLTGKLRDSYMSKVEELSDYDFTLFNIYTIKIEMNKTVAQGVENTILALFEEYSNKYHYYDETSKNVHYYNGWKTNKAYKVGKKVIIPCALTIERTYTYDKGERINYNAIRGNVDKLIDTEKVFNYLDGGLTDGDDVYTCLSKAALINQSSKIKCKYFELTFYKKGTCHITFTNLELLKKFNIFGSQKKGWLPPNYGKKSYSDMAQKEKEVIDDFEGEESYKKVLDAKSYYLSDTASLLMLEAN